MKCFGFEEVYTILCKLMGLICGGTILCRLWGRLNLWGYMLYCLNVGVIQNCGGSILWKLGGGTENNDCGVGLVVSVLKSDTNYTALHYIIL